MTSDATVLGGYSTIGVHNDHDDDDDGHGDDDHHRIIITCLLSSALVAFLNLTLIL